MKRPDLTYITQAEIIAWTESELKAHAELVRSFGAE